MTGHHAFQTGIYSLVLNVTRVWLISTFFAKNISYKKHNCCDIIFVKKFQTNNTCVTFKTREYLSSFDMQVGQVVTFILEDMNILYYLLIRVWEGFDAPQFMNSW